MLLGPAWKRGLEALRSLMCAGLTLQACVGIQGHSLPSKRQAQGPKDFPPGRFLVGFGYVPSALQYSQGCLVLCIPK